MNLMSNARLFHDDEKNRNDLMFDMLPQVKFNMMGQIQHEMKKPPSPYSSSSLSSSSSSPSPKTSGENATLRSSPTPSMLSGKNKLKGDASRFGLESSVQRRPGRTVVGFPEDDSHHHPSEDAPLDFSNKKHKYDKLDQSNVKVKLSKTQQKISQENSEPDSPCSRLRNILKMKSPVSPVFPKELSAGTVLNLSKDTSPSASIDWNHIRNNTTTSNSSSSSSPTDMDMHSFIPSPRAATIPGDATGPVPTYPFSFSSTMAQSLGLSPYSIFSTNFSPVIPQTTPTTSTPFDSPHGSIFSHADVGASSGSSNLPFGSIPPSTSPSGTLPTSSGAGKSRVTRPFKAYPKDPLTFPTVGLYGIPSVGPTPGVTEALIHQQSNHAYAEFRKQMLSQSNNSKSKRLGHPKNSHIQGPLSDSTTSSTNPLDFGLGGGMSGSDAMGNGSGGEDCHSDDGYCGGTQVQQLKNRLNKSDEQLKDEAYWERRRKNNEAAKRSRDARRAKEDEIAIRAAFLEQENLKLRFEVCALKNETAKLRCMLYKAQ